MILLAKVLWDFIVTYYREGDYDHEYPLTPMAGGDYTILVTGKDNYEGSYEITLKIVAQGDMAKAKVKNFQKKIAWVNYNHKIDEDANGIEQPGMIVTLNGRTLVAGEDYILEYSNNKSVGNATVKIEGKGAYTGSKVLTYKITGKSVAKAKVQWYDGSNGVYTYRGSEEPYNADEMFDEEDAKLFVE